MLRGVLVETLERSGYRVLEAADADRALAVADKHGPQIALLLTDVVMPRTPRNRPGHTEAGSGCSQGDRYGRLRRRFASSSPTTVPVAWSHSRALPSRMERLARMQAVVET